MNKLYPIYLTMLQSIRSLNDVVITNNQQGDYEDMNFTCEWELNGVAFMYWISDECPEELAAVRNVNDTTNHRLQYIKTMLELSIEKFSEVEDTDTVYNMYEDEHDVNMTTEQMVLLTAELDRIKRDILDVDRPNTQQVILLPYVVGQNEPSIPVAQIINIPVDVTLRDIELSRLYLKYTGAEPDGPFIISEKNTNGYGDLQVECCNDVYLFVTFVK